MIDASAERGAGSLVSTPPRRLTSLVVALALVCGVTLLVQHRADAAPTRAAVAAASAAVASAVPAQIGFTFVCAILISIRNAFANTFFAAIVVPILNALIASFGCSTSGG